MNLACIITGDRGATRNPWEEIIRAELDWLRTYLGDGDELIVIHGAQKKWNQELRTYTGIDWIADAVCREDEIPVEPFPANWNTYGKAAGPMRNTDMLTRLLSLQREGYRTGVLAFHDDLEHSKGTGDMVRQAEAAGVAVLTYTSQSRKRRTA